MPFLFKQKSFDFIVSEKLPFEPSGQGDALYVYFEKQNMTTQQVIRHLRNKFGLTRMTLGVAGLKDKKALTRQRITIYDRALAKMGGERVFIDALKEEVKVLEVTRHSHPIGMTTPISNQFHIRLRADGRVSKDEKQHALDFSTSTLREGFPNLFGEQRFGIEGRNIEQGRDLMLGRGRKFPSPAENQFKLQAFVSKVFNDYVHLRMQNRQTLIDGDLVMWVEKGKTQLGVYSKETNLVTKTQLKGKSDKFFVEAKMEKEVVPYTEDMVATGPVAGFDTVVAPKGTEAGDAETAFVQQEDLTVEHMKIFRDMKIFGLRRPLWVTPSDVWVRYQGEDLLIDFTLPSGSYASVPIQALMRELKIREANSLVKSGQKRYGKKK